ncbi:M15 family metallopeptidase [Synechocystis sp. LKSZ1]|uniref:M15 family metallopeptidase n=1 Tax=Synechocystis sp. LKSZ1 TaxID=3144951 RepID=UPI00336C14DD
MKFPKIVADNFQVFNFFLASLIVGILFGWWYLPNSKDLASTNQKSEVDKSVAPSFNEQFKKTLEKSKAQSSPDSPLIKTNPSVMTSIGKPPEVSEANMRPLLPEMPPESLNIPQQNLQPQVAYNNLPPNQAKTYLGHHTFAENPRQRLVTVGKYYDRTESLDQEAANAFWQMQRDAKAQGIQLTIISGFRSIADQEKLFQRQIQRRGSKQAAARLSAPPGHSEHHTGYALDIGDGTQPSADLKFDFQSTPAYQWLARNSHNYGFELSFPPGNSQGVSFEPWHWRYVGSPRSNQIFSFARSNR